MIWHGLAWALVLSLLGLWSLGCWMASAVLGWAGWSQGLDWAAEAAKLELPGWLSRWLGLDWVVWVRELLIEFGPWLHEMLSGLPDLSGWLTLTLWIVWALGAAFLLAVGGIGSLVIALVRRPQTQTQNARP